VAHASPWAAPVSSDPARSFRAANASHISARKTHKWLGLFIGLQVVIWSLSGLYMTVVHIDTIHGDHLIRALPPNTVDAAKLADPLTVLKANNGQSVRLAWVRNRPAYVVKGDAGETVVDARNYRSVPPPAKAEIRSIAKTTYTGSERSSTIGTSRRSTSRRPPASWSLAAMSCGASSTSSGCCTSWTTSGRM
jgi:uncharacterized iron-regulated membrane protein